MRYIISKELVDELLNFVASHPYNQVYNLVKKFETLVVIEESSNESGNEPDGDAPPAGA